MWSGTIRLSLACTVQIYTASTYLDHAPILFKQTEPPLYVYLNMDTIASVVYYEINTKELLLYLYCDTVAVISYYYLDT